jgi:hypothetical protein
LSEVVVQVIYFCWPVKFKDFEAPKYFLFSLIQSKSVALAIL